MYIGQSIDLQERKRGHKYSTRGKDRKYYLQRAFIKYGIENFKFEVIEYCEEFELDDKEIYWIAKYNTHGEGYNLTEGGLSGNKKVTDEVFKRIYKDLKYTNNSYEEIGDNNGVSVVTVGLLNTGYRYRREGIDYPIRENIHKREPILCKGCKVKLQGFRSMRCRKCFLEYKSLGRPEKDELVELIAKKGFEYVGREYGVSGNAVKKWCKTLGIPHLKKEVVKLYNKNYR